MRRKVEMQCSGSELREKRNGKNYFVETRKK